MDKKTLERYFKNGCTPEEQDAVEYWLTDKKNKAAVEMMIESLWRDFEYTEEGQEPAPSFSKIIAGLKLQLPVTPKTVKLYHTRWIYSAVAALILISGIIFFTQSRKTEDPDLSKFITISTQKGERKHFILGDGSEVYLNGDSKLRYSAGLGQQPMYLEGEAYFKIANANEPVIIRSQGLETKVRASVFNISAFPKDSTVTLAVDKGNAEVSNQPKFLPLMAIRRPGGQMMAATGTDSSSTSLNSSGEKFMPLMKLRPALITDSTTYAVFNKQQNQLNLHTFKKDKELFGWKNGILYFQNASYDEIASKLERWYGINISFCATKVQLPAYNAEFTNQDLTEVLYKICNTLNLTYKIEGKNVYLCNRAT
ncbi:MAG: FecR family protein [Pedobacter sp.]|nr:MAG: FecR family protein [Pedobacter sp.]